MSQISIAPDVSALEIPMDAWTQPFWDATANRKLLLPRCSNCHRFRWPPGPFCPYCQSQQTDWMPAGIARLYSFTLVADQGAKDAPEPRLRVPALIEFSEADGVRLVAAVVNTPIEKIRIGAELTLGWSQAANATVPVFSIPL
jgi:uncharacterized OB-fold protein